MVLNNFFRPRTIAVIGVSRSRHKLGSKIYQNILAAGFRGKLIPINPHVAKIGDQKCYPSISRYHGRVDLAVVVTPAVTVPAIINDCGRLRVKSVIVISSGFKETGPEGAERERELSKIADKYGIKLLGPNCLGLIHGDYRINASFCDSLKPGGSVAIISQSGALASAITDWGRQSGVGFRSVVSLGNSAGLTESDFLDYFSRDSATRAILLYLESVRDGIRFMDTIRRASVRKPVVVFWSGLSALGQKAARSHTGALASEREITLAALRQSGAIRAASLKELFDLAALFSTGQRLHGPRLAIVTNAGGPAIISADRIAETDLRLAEISPKTKDLLRKFLPRSASLFNPIDIIGDADESRYRRTLEIIGSDKEIDGLIIILTPQVVTQPEETAETIVRLRNRFPQKVFTASFLGGQQVEKAKTIFEKNKLPHFDFPESAVDSLNRLWEYEKIRQGQKLSHKAGNELTKRIRKRPFDGMMLSPAVHEIIKKFGIQTVKQQTAKSKAEALNKAKRLGYPLVLKLLSHKIVHKAKKQAVWTNITNSTELKKVLSAAERKFPFDYRKSPDEGWLIQKMITGRDEWFLGGKNDSVFGPTVLLGIGGTEVETTGRTITLLSPFEQNNIKKILLESSLGPLIKNKINGRTLDLAALIKSAIQLGRLLHTFPEILEIDLNPMFLGEKGKGVVSVDARAILK